MPLVGSVGPKPSPGRSLVVRDDEMRAADRHQPTIGKLDQVPGRKDPTGGHERPRGTAVSAPDQTSAIEQRPVDRPVARHEGRPGYAPPRPAARSACVDAPNDAR